MTDDTARRLPFRIVDASHRGWYRVGPGPDSYLMSGVIEPLTYAGLLAERGPLREVVPPSSESVSELRRAIRAAGTKAVGSLLAALGLLALEYGVRPGKPATGSLLAGREGSWESSSMQQLMWGLGLDLAERPKRLDAGAVEAFTEVLRDWTSGPEYTEVAENLASVFSAVADDIGGWTKVADRPFQAGNRFAHGPGVIQMAHGWLMSQTEGGYVGLYE